MTRRTPTHPRTHRILDNDLLTAVRGGTSADDESSAQQDGGSGEVSIDPSGSSGCDRYGMIRNGGPPPGWE